MSPIPERYTEWFENYPINRDTITSIQDNFNYVPDTVEEAHDAAKMLVCDLVSLQTKIGPCFCSSMSEHWRPLITGILNFSTDRQIRRVIDSVWKLFWAGIGVQDEAHRLSIIFNMHHNDPTLFNLYVSATNNAHRLQVFAETFKPK